MALLTTRAARRYALGALPLTAALVLAGCSSDGEGDSATGETVTIGVEAEYPPGEYLDTDGETVLGFNVELVEAALAEIGMEAEWEPANFDAIIIGVNSGTYDMGASSLTVTEQDRKSTRLNSSHVANSYAVFCVEIKNTEYK